MRHYKLVNRGKPKEIIANDFNSHSGVAEKFELKVHPCEPLYFCSPLHLYGPLYLAHYLSLKFCVAPLHLYIGPFTATWALSPP